MSLWRIVGAVLLLALPAGADGPPMSRTNRSSFLRDVAPILVQKCQKCHGPKKAKGHFRLDTFTLLMKGGDDLAVAPGAPGKSKLYQLITTTDEDDRMPQKGDPLSRPEIERIGRWIRGGAAFDGPDPNLPLANLIQLNFPSPPERYPRVWPALALAFRPDGKEMAVAGYDEITLWDPAQGKLLRRIKPLPQRIQALAFSPDGQWLAAAGGEPGLNGAVLLCPPAGGECRLLARGADMFLTAAISPDSKWLAAGGTDNAIHLFSLAGPVLEKTWAEHADWVASLEFRGDSARLLSASRDRSVRILKVPTGEVESAYHDQEAPVTAAVFDARNETVLSAGRDGKIHRWRTSDGKKLGETQLPGGGITRLLRHADDVLAASADGEVRELNARSLKVVREFSTGTEAVFALAEDPAHDRLAAGTRDGRVCIWDMKSGQEQLSWVASPGWWRLSSAAPPLSH